MAAVLTLAALFVPAVTAAQDGPTPPPKDLKDWPGRGHGYVYDLFTERRAEFWANREADNGAVVFYGDSITHRWTTLAQDFPGLKVANRGIGGDRSRGLLVRMPDDVLALDPRAVVILIGFNDLNTGGQPMDTAYNIGLMVSGIQRKNPKTPVILCKMMPSKRVHRRLPEGAMALNRLIEGVAIGRPNVAVCDTWTPFATEDNLASPEDFPDGVHPSPAGYQKWRDALMPVLRKMGITQE